MMEDTGFPEFEDKLCTKWHLRCFGLVGESILKRITDPMFAISGGSTWLGMKAHPWLFTA